MTGFRRMTCGTARLAVFLAPILVLGFLHAPGGEPSAARSVAERTLDCTVGIRCELEKFMNFTGTGIVISPQGHILTATSVVPAAAKRIRVTFPGFVVRDAELTAVDESLGVAIIKVTADGLPFLPLSRHLPAVGSTAYTASDVENALLTNGRASFSRGIVSGVYDVPKHPEAAYAGIAIETTAAVNPGSDGGPLVDAAGRVCGVITLGTLPLRWQGTAVPTKILLEKFAVLASGTLSLPDAPAVEQPRQPPAEPLRTLAAEVAAHLVGIDVERQYPPEILPRLSWEDFRAGVGDYAALPEPKRQQKFADYINVARAFEVNQLLRRPLGASTGLVVSPDGFVLTSLFNVGGDMAFVRKDTGKPRPFDPHEPIQKMLAEPTDGVEQRPNAVKRITVTLPDGGRHEAKIVAKHEPLGVALLKIDARDLAWYDVAGNSVSPQLGDAVGLVGHLPGGATAYTLNTGIVSAPSRNRGYQFQTDALLNYGNSGGPVFDRAGNFLGLATAPIQPDTLIGRLVAPQQLMAWTRAPNSGVGMAARADRIRDVLDALKSGKSFDRIPGPSLGVLADESKAFADTVVIGGVAPGSPAEKAGLKRGDVVLELDGAEVRSWNDLTERITACKAGQVVELKFQRRGGGPRLVIAGRDVETADDLKRLKQSLKPGERFEGVLSTDEARTIQVTLGGSP
jgi:S1-C subfamily serine protease